MSGRKVGGYYYRAPPIRQSRRFIGGDDDVEEGAVEAVEAGSTVGAPAISSTVLISVFVALGILGVLGTIGFSYALFLRGASIFTISGVAPNGDGELTARAGTGMLVVPGVATNDVTFTNDGVVTATAGSGVSISSPKGDIVVSNTGVLSVTGGTAIGVSAASGDVTINNLGVTSNVAGPGIGVSAATGASTISNLGVLSVASTGAGLSVDMPTGALTLQNTGVTSNIAGPGIGVDVNTGAVTISNNGVINLSAQDGVSTDGATGFITVKNVLTTQTLLDVNDANGPQVSYTNQVGSVITANEAAWYNTESSLFTTVMQPGIDSGEGGQGNIAGASWAVPTAGEYHIFADCVVTPSAIAATDVYFITLVMNFGATTLAPDGFTPHGGMLKNVFSSPVALGATQLQYTMSAAIHAGCAGCSVAVNDVFTMHHRIDRQGAGGAITFSTSCRILFTRQK